VVQASTPAPVIASASEAMKASATASRLSLDGLAVARHDESTLFPLRKSEAMIL
jgi:hypothetical protein